jgi:outer membrane protein assembly factor BamB
MMNHKILKWCLVSSAVFLVGCSTLTELRQDMADRVFGREPPNPPAALVEFTASQTAKLDWSSQTGDTGRYDYTPALEAGFVYATNAKGELTKLDAESGRQEWRVNAEEPISGGVGTGGGLVLIGTNRGHVMAYDVSGKLVWKSQLSSEVLSAPRYSNGMVIARSGDNRIYGLDAVDGNRKWVYERKVPALSLRSSVGVVVDGGAVYAGFSGGKMAAIRADNGTLLWEATVAIPKGVTEIERIADITSLPVVAGPVVYAIAYQGRIAAVDRISGKVLWNREISSYSGIDFKNEKIYVSHALGSLYSLDYATGRTFWRQGDLLNRRLTAPLAMSRFVAVGDLEGYVHFLNLENGQFTARMKVNSEPVMSLLEGNSPSQVIVATRGGGLYAVSVSGDLKSSATSVESKVPAEKTEPIDNQNADDTQRSILFKKDSILLPDDQFDSGPGISLPKAE